MTDFEYQALASLIRSYGLVRVIQAVADIATEEEGSNKPDVCDACGAPLADDAEVSQDGDTIVTVICLACEHGNERNNAT